MGKKISLKLIVLFLCLAVLFTWIRARHEPFVVQAGHSRLNLRYDRSYQPSYAGPDGRVSTFDPRAATPLSLASADFTADGSPDLVQGYATGGAGVVALYRGNPEAFAARRNTSPHPYVNQAIIYDIPEAPDFLITGDFNQDGYPDVLAAARGSKKAYLLTGDGSGALADPKQIDLPGNLTALTAAHFHTGDIGLDVVAAVRTSDGPALLYYEASQGGLGTPPVSLALPFEASMLRTGLLDDDASLDLAIAGNGQLMILHGAAQPWNALAAAAQSRLESINLPAPAAAITLGDFISDRTNRTEIAALSTDGLTLSILSRGTANSDLWQTARTVTLSSRVDLSNPNNVLTSGRFTDDAGEQVLVVDSTGRQIVMFAATGTDVLEQVLSVSAENTPVAAIAARTSSAPRSGLAILQRGPVASFLNVPGDSVLVSTTDDVLDAPDLNSLAALAAHPGLDGKISLREAVIASNNGGGSNRINVPAGTFTLTRRLDVLTSTTIVGAGSTSTIIQAGTTSANGTGRIFSFNPQGARKGIAVSMSGLTLRYGNNAEGNGGAFDFDAGPDFGGSFLMSDVVLDQNATTAGSGGAAAFYNGGTITIENSTISNNAAHSDGTGVFGGGLFFGPVPSAADGTVSITNTSVSGNSGGGLASLTIPMGVHNSRITGNRTTNAGGGVYGAVALDEATVVSNNTAGSGGGIAGWGTISGVTISNNSAEGPGGGILAIAEAQLTVNNSRIVGNSSTNGKSAADVLEGAAIQAVNNWWGSNDTPEGAVARSGVVFDPWLQMTFTASPDVVTPGHTSTLTASIRTNSHNQTGFFVPRVANNTPVAFAFSGVDGTSADPGTAATVSGAAISTLNTGSAAGDGTASATIDAQTLSKAVKVNAKATHLVVTAPAVATPQVPFTITVTAVDASNNTDTTYSGIVSFTSSDPAALLPANTALVNGVGMFSVTLQTPGSQTVTASDFNTPSISGTATIVVNQNVATHFQVISPNSATAGLPFSLLVTALDSANNVAKNYNGTVKFSSTDPKAVFPATATLTAGLGIFNVTLETAGPQTITVTDINTPSTTGTSGTTIVHAGPPTQFAIAAPATVITGMPFTFTTTITDAFGNPASGYVGTLHFTSSDPNAVLPADSTLNNGSGTFQATLKAIGIQTITATDTVIPSITGTASIRVLQLPGTHFSVTLPATVTAATPFNFTVQALDVNNQPTSNYTGTVHFTSSDALATLPANSTLTNGVGTFSATLKTGGTQTITATDTVTPSITGTGSTNVIGGPAVSIAVTAPPTATAGVPFTFTVTAKDQFGNVAPGYSGTLHFTSTDPLAVLPPNATLTNGVGTFPATLKTLGNQTITATDTVTPALSGTSNPILVSIGQATHFSVTAPATAIAGQAFNFTVTALDIANNTVVGYTGTVHFTSTDPAAVLPANATLTNGTGTFPATLKTAGTQTITATDTVTASITGTSNPIVVSAGTATTFAIAAPSSVTAGTAFNFTVTAKDAFGNTATGYAGTVHFTSSDAAAVLPANSTLTNGTGSFSATLMTDGSQTLTATDTVTPSITGTATITVGSGTAMHLVVSAPSTVTAGTPFNFTVTAKDGSGNTVTSYSGTVHFSSTDPAAVLPANATLTNGTGTFQATLKTTGTQTITATDTLTATITGTSNPIQVTPGAATTLIVSAPASVTAGASFNFTVTAKDMNGNVVTGYNGTLHFTSTDSSAVLPADAMLVNGTGTFPAVLKTAGTQTITAVDTVNSGINGTSNPILVTPATAISFSVSAPSAATAGNPFNFTVTAKDAFGNVVTGYSGTLHFTSTDAAALLPVNAMLTNGAGSFQATLNTTGTQTITATDTVTPTITGTSNPINVGAGTAMTIVVSAPATATAGTAFNFTVTAKDKNGNVVTGYNGTLHFTSTDLAAILPPDAMLVNGVGTFPATLNTAGTQTITATDTVTAGLSGTSNPILVTAGIAVKFVVAAPSTATANVPFNFTVTAKDAHNNTVMNYAGTVHFTSTDAAAMLPVDATLTNGVGSFPATLNTSGTQTITATDTVTPAITGTSGPIVVGSGSAMTLVVSAPATAIAGTPFSFTVTAKDSKGNTVTSYNGTLHFTSTDGAAALPADTMLVNGTGTFAATLKTSGTQTITATDTANPLISGTSNPILVTAGAPVQFVVSAPSSATAGTPFNFTVTAKDANNNTVTNYAGTVHFTSTDAAAALPADATLTNGSGTFPATLKTAGTQTITATDTATPAITGTSNPIAVGAGVAISITVSAPGTVQAGSPFNFTVTAKDANGNTATGYAGTLHFTSTDATAVLPSDTTLTNGAGSFQATLKTTGTQTITATDTATPSITGTSNPIVVTAGAPMHLVVSAPSSVTAGVPFNFTVTAQDVNGNVVPSYSGTLHFTSSDSAAVLPPDAKLTNGVGSFPATLKTSGTQTITATDIATPAITGTSNPIQVSAATATHISVSAPSTATAGVPINFTVTALDAFNNTATGYTGTLHFTSTDPAAVLPPDAKLTNGAGSFQATLKTAGTQTITATDTATPSITGTSNPIAVSAAAATTLVVSAPSMVTAGATFGFTVTAKDAFNNTATSYAGTLHFTSTDPAAVLPANAALTNGVGSFSAILKTTGIQTITATDTATPTISGTSGPITVVAGAAMTLIVTAPPAAIAGVPFNFTVTAKDSNGNVVTGYTGTLHFTSSDPKAVLPADSMLTNGVGTFPATLKTAGPQTITATDVAAPAITATSNTIQVSAATATQLSVTAPSRVTAGAAFTFTVTALDAFNNTATGYTGTLHFTSTDPAAVLPADMALMNGVGSFGATLKTTGIQTITATDTATPSITGTSAPIMVNPGAAMTLVVTAPSTAIAGVPFNFTVTAKDSNGNVVTNYNGTLHFTSSDAAGVLPADSKLTNGVGTFPATLKTAGPQTITATDVAVPAITATSNTIQVTAGTATHLSVTAPASATAGASFSVKVTALDAFNNTATGYTGTLHFTSTDAAAVLPADTTLTNGVGSFSATLKTTGVQTITATDTVTPSITGTSGPITVNPGAATLLVVTAPSTATAGVPFNFTVTAKDSNGNVVTNYNGTLHFTSSDAAGVLPADSKLTNGVGTFPATLKTAGSQTITATDVAAPAITATSNPIQVSAGTATHLSVSAPSTAIAGVGFTFTVTALDAFNNTATAYSGTLHFTSTDAAATLPPNASLTNGVGTFPATLKTAGNQTITATDTVTPAITGTSNPILVAGGTGTHFSVTAPANATAGVPFNFTVTALDANNNTATAYSGTVHFSSTDAAAILPANATLSNGTGTFPATLKTTGTQTITATDTANPAITGTSGPIAVTSGNATHFSVVAPGSATAGSAFSFTVTAMDQFNNIATTYTGTVHFSSTDGAAILPANSTLASGTGAFQATLKTMGVQTISATDTVTPAITGTSNPITVGAGITTHFSVTAPASVTGSVPFTFTVAALDQFNNAVPSYAGTVHFTSTDALAVLPGNAALTNGTGTFQATLKTSGNQTITATDVAAPSITGTSNPIAVAILPATHFTITGPSATMAGIPVSVTVTALDSNNNPVLNYAGTVHFSSTDAQATLAPNSTLTNGTGTFPVTLRTPGLQMVTATDVATPSLTASLSISVTAGAATHLVVVGPATANSGTSFNVTVTALDQANNVAIGYTGTVHFTSTDASAVLPGNTALVNGVATVPATLITGGNQTITATDAVNPAITGTSNPIAVGVAIVVQTLPAGRTFLVDGVTYTSAQTFFFQPGTTHTLLVSPTTQSGGTGTQYMFSSWNTSSNPVLQITAGTTGATYTANFTTQYLLTTSVSPAASGSVTPPSGFYNAGTTVTLTAAPATGFTFVNWSGPVTVTGTFTATVVLNAPTSVVAFFSPTGPPQVPVLTPDPTALFVTYYRGTTPITTTRSVNLVSTNGDTLYSVSSSLPWISVTPTPGFTPAVVTVNFNFAGLTAGVYPGTLTVVTPYQSIPIPVTVTVVDFPMLVATPASLNIPIATPTSVPQSLDVLLSATNRELPFSLSSTASWLTVSSVNAQNMMTPARLHITADPSGMPNGIYTGSILVSADGATNTPLAIPVTMVIGTQNQSIQVSSFANGASFQTGPAAPNTIMSIFGSNFTCDTESAVMVDGLPAEVLGSTPNQINFVVPADDPNLNTAHIQVACGINVSPMQLVSMAATNPGVFTVAASGTGPGSILNQNISLNSATAGASRGSIVSVFVTGFGQLGAPDADGLRRLVLPVTATIGGVPADIMYAGAAPGYTSGLQQINIRVPDNAPVGAQVPIVLTAGGVTTQTGVTMTVN